MRSEPRLVLLATALWALGCARPPVASAPPPASVPEGWFSDPGELCDRIRQAAAAADEAALARLEIPESLWIASTWETSEARRAAVDSAHERASREFARWLHQANSRKGRQRLIQALRENSVPRSGCPPFEGEPAALGPLVVHAFADSAGQVRLAGSLARLAGGWRVHSYAEAGAKR